MWFRAEDETMSWRQTTLERSQWQIWSAQRVLQHVTDGFLGSLCFCKWPDYWRYLPYMCYRGNAYGHDGGGSLTQSILIELRRLPAPHHTVTLCGCKSLHRQLLQPCRLLRLQLLKQGRGRHANTLCYDRSGFIPGSYQIQSDGDDNPLLLEKTVCAVNIPLTFKTA